jgi:hypothetical protein
MRLIAILVAAACAAAPVTAAAADAPAAGVRPATAPDPSPTPPPKTTVLRNALCPIDEQPIDEHLAPIELTAAQCPHHPELAGALIGTCTEEHRRLVALHPERYEEQIWKVCRGAEIARERAQEKPAEAKDQP